MKIPIPKQYDAVMDWLAMHLLPPDKPTRLRLFGHNVTWLEVAVTAYPTIAAFGLWAWTGDWWWLPMIAGGMAFAIVTMGWK